MAQDYRWVKRRVRSLIGLVRCWLPSSWAKRACDRLRCTWSTETYVLVRTALQGLLYLSLWRKPSSWASRFVLLLTLWLLLDMVTALMDILLFHRERAFLARKDRSARLDPTRSMLLLFANVLQAVFAFALFYCALDRACANSFRIDLGRALSGWDWVNYSWLTMAGLGDQAITPVGNLPRCVVSVQQAVGLVLIVIAVGTFASMLLEPHQARGDCARE